MEIEGLVKLDNKANKDKKGYDYKNIMFLGKGAYGEVCLFERQGNLANNVFAEFFFN